MREGGREGVGVVRMVTDLSVSVRVRAFICELVRMIVVVTDDGQMRKGEIVATVDACQKGCVCVQCLVASVCGNNGRSISTANI